MSDLEVVGDDEEFRIQGDLETSSVPELLRSFLLGHGESGVLTFKGAGVSKSVHIREGRIVLVTSTDPDERLGENLLVRGRITVTQFLEASRLIRPGRRLGAILVELQAIEPEDLLPVVEQQVRDLLMDLFSWSKGSYEMLVKELDPEEGVPLHISNENLLLEGMRRVRSWTRVVRGVGGVDAILAPTGNTEMLYRLELTPEEQELLTHLNGRTSVEQVCDVSYLSSFETCRTLWTFIVLGLARRVGSTETTGDEEVRARHEELDIEDIVEKYNQMFARIYTFLRGRIGEKVDPFMDAVQEDISRQYAALFVGVDLKQYGRADYEQMLANVAELPPDQRKTLLTTALNELIFIIQLAVRTRCGVQEDAVVGGIIKDGFRRLGFA